MKSQDANYSMSLLFTFSLILFTLLGLSWNNVSAQGQTCHLRELDLCAATLLVFTQSPSGIAVSEQEINKQCNHLKDSDNCFKNYTRRCMTPLQREMVTYASNTSFTMLNEYCTKGSPLRTNYLKHATCLNKVDKKQQRECLRDLQNSLELLTSGNETAKRFQLGCCSMRKFETCVASLIEKKCGKEPISFIQDVIRRVTGRVPETVCSSYKPEGQECKALLPKANLIPKGAKSNSIVSRLMSAYTGL